MVSAANSAKKTVRETVIDGEVKLKKVREASHDAKANSKNKIYATGKRKTSIAKVWLQPGKGEIVVNDMASKEYLKRAILETVIRQPLVSLEANDKFDVTVKVEGGGLTGQAGAILLGIAKCLASLDEENHKVLRTEGFLTRDSRIVERKKFGLHKARKARTFRKR